MADSGEEKPDASSIKPVSSLLSHFENISNTNPSAALPTLPNPATAVLEQERARSSLDLPRKPSPWGGGGEMISSKPSQDATAPGKPIPRQLPPGVASRPRPASTGPWSPPRTPPTLTLQSPVSPPKALFSSSVPTKSNPQTAPNVPSRTFSKSPSLLDSLPSRPNGNLDRPELSIPRLAQSARTSPVPTKRAPPPPINRASKPTTPIAGTFNFDVTKNSSKDRISPFSTPPESDESLEKDNQLQPARNLPRPVPGQNSYFPPPPVHHAVEARRAADTEQAKRKSSVVTETRPQLPSRPPDRSDQPDQRPDLPTRPQPRVSPPRQRRAETEVSEPPRIPTASKPPPRPSDASKFSKAPAEFLPPPKRGLIPSAHGEKSSPDKYMLTRSVTEPQNIPIQTSSLIYTNPDPPVDSDSSSLVTGASATDYPDASQVNRRPPKSMCGVHRVWTEYDTKLFDLCGSYVCSGGYIVRAWDNRNARLALDHAPQEREIKVTALVFKPGKTTDEEGNHVWLGNNVGEIQEVDLKSQQVLDTKSNAHGRREIIKMYRHQNSIWSLDEEGKLHVWAAGDNGTPSFRIVPMAYRVSRGHTFSMVVRNLLWLANGKDIRIYNPSAGEEGFNVTMQALCQPTAGEITSGAVVSNQLDKVYFGHSDGKVSIYSTKDFSCHRIVNVSSYKINCLAGAGVYLWAGYNTGMIYVYDTQRQPWKVVKEWQAHTHPVLNFAVDRSSLWKFGHLQLASLGADNAICFWDGMLEDDWIESDMQQHDVDYCIFNEIKTVVMTWNAGASTPSSLRNDEKSLDVFRQIVQTQSPPDILVFGFQELVDLEDKKLTAKSFFKGSKKKEPGEAEHMSHQYRVWRDFLVQLLDDNMPASETYHLLHTASMVGLFSCIFVKASLRSRVSKLGVAEVKRGLGGLHGNKGSIMVRFLIDDSSLCFTNCHLAAGQSQTVNRNNDITAILEAAALPNEPDSEARVDSFSGGGDGSMIMDHEICIVNGDLNYRIDTMGRDTVVKAINAKNFNKLLDRDQLLVSKRRNPAFRLRSFQEQAITFAPTYKYDVGTDRYDSSEKNRSPAWCDRLLYRGPGRIKQIDYRRHELRLSDHRPVSGTFLMRLKSIDPKRRAVVWEQCEKRLQAMRRSLGREIKLEYLITIMGVGEKEARKLLEK